MGALSSTSLLESLPVDSPALSQPIIVSIMKGNCIIPIRDEHYLLCDALILRCHKQVQVLESSKAKYFRLIIR